VFLALITIVSGGAMTIFAIPIGLIIIGFFVLRAIGSGRGGPQVVPAPHEPSGTPRSQRGDAETANVRVGQD
jgi:hypothetical protein